MDKRLIAILFCLMSCGLAAQEFEVRSFRLLQNDITAWVNPVKDLNDEACALIKVVGDADFAFSTPLGIVARRNEVGEIWLYVPNGTVKLTIKHPKWGVLRDYKFPSALESRLTYELVLVGPPPKEEESPYPKMRRRMARGVKNRPLSFDLAKMEEGKRRGTKPACFLLASWGVQEHENTGGLMAGIMKRHGVFVHGQTNFRSFATEGECDENGLWKEMDAVPYYKTGVDYSVWTLTLGAIHRVVGLWHVFEGIGYGERKVVWESLEGVRLRNADYSCKGWAAEVGCMVEVRRFAFSVGVTTIKGEYWLPSLGVGINF